MLYFAETTRQCFGLRWSGQGCVLQVNKILIFQQKGLVFKFVKGLSQIQVSVTNVSLSLLFLFVFRGCYGKKFGAKGYGFAGGSGFLQTGDL